MQSNKSSKKTGKITDEETVPATELAAAETASKPRTSKSSTTKSKVTKMASGKQHRKSSSNTVTSGDELPAKIDPLSSHVLPPVSKPIIDTPTRAVRPHEIAELAYAYFVERGYSHGSAEDDWFRAERALTAR